MNNLNVRYDHKVIDSYMTPVTIATYQDDFGNPMSSRFSGEMYTKEQVISVLNFRRKRTSI